MDMYLGEMALLVVSVPILIGMVKGITARLRINDYIASVAIFLIVLLNVRGGIRIGERFSLSLGGLISLPLCTFIMIKRSEKASDVFYAMLSMLGVAGITFLYSLHFLEVTSLDPRLIAFLLSLVVGLWCAFSARRTFSSCLFSAVVGSFVGITPYLIFIRKNGNIGGSYTFAVMWMGALLGMIIQYLLTYMMRAIKSPRADSYFEAGEMKEETEEGKKE